MGGARGQGGQAELGSSLPRELLEAVLDLVPTPVALVEPGTGRLLFANRAADRLAGGALALPGGLDDYDSAFACFDLTGRRLGADELPAARVARGERVEGFQLDWDVGGRVLSVLVSGDVHEGAGGQGVGVLAFEDVTAVRVAERLRDESVALLDTLFASAPVGLAFLDRDLRYARVNAALAAMNGVPVEAHVGRTVPEVLPGIDDAVVLGLREVMRTGEPRTGVEVTAPAPDGSGERTFLGSWYPVRAAASGEVLGLGAIVAEITERVALLRAERRARQRAERAERRAAFLMRAGDVLASSLDVEETLRNVARIAVPAKADWCLVDVLGPDGVLRRLAIEHADPATRELWWELARRHPAQPDDAVGPWAVLRSGEPVLLEEVTDADLRLAARDEEHLRILREQEFASAILVPLRLRARPIGVLTFLLARTGARYGGEDLDLALEVARRASIAIEHARLYEERSHIARTLQRSLLPASLPEIPGFELAARYRAAGEGFEVGGDFYDVFPTGEEAWSLVVGDVCGKGPEAASLTSLARYTVRAAALSDGRPSAVLALTDEAIRRERTDGRFISVVHGALRLDDEQPVLTLANAGHPPVLHLRAAGGVAPSNGRGAVLGTGMPPHFDEVEVALAPGDVLVAYTDGVLDAAAPKRMRGPDALGELLLGLGGLPAAQVAERVEAWALEAADGEARDDIAVLVLRRLP